MVAVMAVVSVVSVVSVSAMGRMILFVIVIMSRGEEVVELVALDAFGDVVLDRGEETLGVRNGIPPGLDCVECLLGLVFEGR
jgi:hypothetical protein